MKIYAIKHTDWTIDGQSFFYKFFLKKDSAIKYLKELFIEETNRIKTRYSSKDRCTVQWESEYKFIEELYGDVSDWFEVLEQDVIEN